MTPRAGPLPSLSDSAKKLVLEHAQPIIEQAVRDAIGKIRDELFEDFERRYEEARPPYEMTYMGGSVQIPPLLSSNITVQPTGAGAKTTDAQTILRNILIPAEYDTIANFNNALLALFTTTPATTVGMGRTVWPTKYTTSATFSAKYYDGGPVNDTFQITYNGSPTLYQPNVLTEPMIWFGMESNFPNSPARDPSFGTDPTCEIYWRFQVAGTTGPFYQEPLFFNFDRNTNQIIRGDIRAEHVTIANTATAPIWLEMTPGFVKEIGSFKATTSSSIGYFGSGSELHELISGHSTNPIAIFGNAHSSTPHGINIQFINGAPNDLNRYFINMLDSAGTRAAIFSNGSPQFCMLSTPSAGGSSGDRVTFSSTSTFGIYWGSGVPTISAAKGSWYMRNDGTNASTRAYTNTDGSTTWTFIQAGA